MVIRVLDHKYFVLSTIVSEDGLDQYVCRDLVDESSDIYRIVRIPHDDVTPELMRYLTDISSSENFLELREYSNESDFLCVVVSCGSAKAVTLNEKIAAEQPPFNERLGYIYRLIERLILSDIPVYFAASGLEADRIRFTPALDCSFDFDIHDIQNYGRCDMKNVCSKMAGVITSVMARELRQNSIAELADMVKRLKLHEYDDYLAIFTDFKAIYEKYGDSKQDIVLEDNSFAFRLWDILKDAGTHLKRYAYLLLLAVAVIYLVTTVRNISRPTQRKDIYSAIGDMQIIGEGGAQETETANDSEHSKGGDHQ